MSLQILVNLTRFAAADALEEQGDVLVHVAVPYLAHIELEPVENQLNQATEHHGHEQGAQSDRAAQKVADDEHADLGQVADHPDLHARALGDRDHHAVAQLTCWRSLCGKQLAANSQFFLIFISG